MVEYFKELYILQLSDERQQLIESKLNLLGLSPPEIENILCSRVSDLSGILNIYSLLGIGGTR